MLVLVSDDQTLKTYPEEAGTVDVEVYVVLAVTVVPNICVTVTL